MLYETILGADFKRLHPKLQERYQQTFEKTMQFKGQMIIADINPLIKPIATVFSNHAFLLSKGGNNIPFVIKTSTTKRSDSIYDVLWERTFHYEDHNRYFDSTMTFDIAKGQVTDYLGNPGVVKAPLQFDVTNDGFLLMRSTDMQQLLLGPLAIPLPSLASAKAFVIEGYNEAKQMHTIHLSTYNDVAGNLMKYVGEFTIEVL